MKIKSTMQLRQVGESVRYPGWPADRDNYLKACGKALLLSVLLVAAPRPVTAQERQSSTNNESPAVSERLAVRETGVLLDLPRLSSKSIGKLAPSDLAVSQAGRILTPTRIARLDPKSEPWTILVYADALGARARSISLAAQSLAEAAPLLAELGKVSVVVAGRDDVSLLDNERDPELISNALTELANLRTGIDTLAMLRRDLDIRPIEDVFLEELNFLRERSDRLLVQATTVCSLPPCLLLNITDGFELAPSAAYHGVSLSVLTKGVGGTTHGDIAQELEQGLTARGWTVVSMALEPTEEDPKGPKNARERHDVGTNFDAWKSTTPGVQTGPPRSRGNRYDGLPSQALDIFTEPRLEPLRILGAATAGATLRLAEQVPIELARLLDRWWLFYLAEDRPVGEPAGSAGVSDTDSTSPQFQYRDVEPLSVDWARESQFQSKRSLRKRLGFVPEEEPLRVQRWARNPSAVLITEARLRSLKRERYLVGNLEIEEAMRPAKEDANEQDFAAARLKLPAAVQFVPLGQRTKVRISTIGPAGSVRHEVLVAEIPESNSSDSAADQPMAVVELPTWARRSTVILEELGSGRWAVLGR